MTKSKLAILGGSKMISNHFKPFNTMGIEEINAVKEVVESGVLSKFLGEWHPDFYGGPKVREFETLCEDFFRVKNAISVNSWTSGLICSVGAIGIEPGDEIILSPWTMCACASSIIHWNAIPVFADIDKDTYNLDPKSVEENITDYTKAIMAIDIFGQSADMDKIMEIAKKYNLKVISDSAQSPGAMYKGKMAGTIADVGGYSLNYHKHIHTGEGGIIVTDNDQIAEKLRLIRNHAEGVVEQKGEKDIKNMVGYNFRLGEIESAIGIQQIKKLNDIIKKRQNLADKLIDGISKLPGLQVPYVQDECSHVYYVFPIQVDSKVTKIHRDKIFSALTAEGLSIGKSYGNLHLLPMFQNKIAYGSSGFPWSSDICKRDVDYSKGICPVSEELNDKRYIGLDFCQYDYTESDIQLIVHTFHKVWNNLDKLK
tara:strand:+ start:352 stop:1629 length:1278 start_codon:yes stop_codon:yes gene_type:complete